MSRPEARPTTAADLTKKLGNLPVLPHVVADLLALSPGAEDYFEQVVLLAMQDPPFAARVIRVANSAVSAPVSEIETIRMAVTRLGAESIARLATSMAVARVFMPSTRGQQDLWTHSLEVAVAAHAIAVARDLPEIDPEFAYLGGLMHDLGRFVLFDVDPEKLDRIDESGWATPEDLIEVERRLLGFDHAEVGWLVCQHWCIPPRVAELVRDHHDYDDDCAAPESDARTQLVGIIQMADLLSTSCLLQGVEERTEQELSQLIEERCVHPCWRRPPIEPRLLAASCAGIATQSQTLIDGLGLAPIE